MASGVLTTSLLMTCIMSLREINGAVCELPFSLIYYLPYDLTGINLLLALT
jgi:hypothetical protein